MADWHLNDLRKALANVGWKLLAVHDGDPAAGHFARHSVYHTRKRRRAM